MTKNLIEQIMLEKSTGNGAFDTAGFIETLQNGYLAERGPKFTQKKAFSPSKIAYGEGKCPRYWYLAFEGGIFEDHSTPFGVANMTNGTKGHERVLGMALKGSGMAIDIEFNVKYDSPSIYGFCDGLLNWKDEDYVLELKTSSSEAFEYRKKHMKAKAGHIEQLLIYMKILNKGKGIILYENKNNHELLPIVIQVNDHYKKWVDESFDWMVEVKKASEEKNIPMKPYRSNAKVCKECPLLSECLKAEAGVLKIKPLEELSEAM